MYIVTHVQLRISAIFMIDRMHGSITSNVSNVSMLTIRLNYPRRVILYASVIDWFSLLPAVQQTALP